MDRRQKKTRESIFQAFRKLLEIKKYESITVQEIIDEADIGRSTFYAHFDTKDELLRSLCTEIFHHVFTEVLPEEESVEKNGYRNLELKLGHILYHIKENQNNVKGIIAADGDGLFMSYFKQYLIELFMQYEKIFRMDVPSDFLIHHLVGSFAETIKWWVAEDTRYAPEEVAEYYMKVLQVYNLYL